MRLLIAHIPAQVNLDLNYLLRDMVLKDGSWNLELFRMWVSDEIIYCIISISPPHPSACLDRIMWTSTDSSNFLVRKAYWTVKQDMWELKDSYWKFIWKFQGP